MAAAINPKLTPLHMKEKRPSGYDLSRTWFEFVLEEHQDVKPHHMALYFFIIERANRSGWKSLIDMPTDYSMNGAKIGNFTTYKNCLLDLERWGFIKWEIKSKNQYGCNKVSVCFDRNAEASPKAPQENNEAPRQKSESTDQSNTQSTDQSTEGIYKPNKPIKPDNLIKPNIEGAENNFDEGNIIPLETEKKEEEKKKKSTAKKEKDFSDVVYPFDSPEFKEAWSIWIEYRKQKKQKPYVPIGLQAVLKQLSNDANGNESEAIEIIKYSMGKNWNGLYPEKNKTSHSPNQQKSNGKPKYSFDELLAEVERTAGPTSYRKHSS